jgi:hypothetical protein
MKQRKSVLTITAENQASTLAKDPRSFSQVIITTPLTTELAIFTQICRYFDVPVICEDTAATTSESAQQSYETRLLQTYFFTDHQKSDSIHLMSKYLQKTYWNNLLELLRLFKPL